MIYPSKRMPRTLLLLTAILLAVITITARQPATALPSMPVRTIPIFTDKGEVDFRIEVPGNEEELERGLMFRTLVPDRTGMLFDFGAPRPVVMWMKNTLIPLDMLFIDNNGVVTSIAANTTPESLAHITAPGLSRAVIELAGGASARYGIKPGTHVDITGKKQSGKL